MEGEIKDHVYLSWPELGDLLGLEGDVHRVYVEADADYLHVIAKQNRIGRNGLDVPVGGHVEPRHYAKDRR